MANNYIEGLQETAAIEAYEYNLVALLRPSITIDGNAWCVLYGENLQEGVAGFGETPYKAVLSFNKEWHRTLSRTADKTGGAA